MALWSDIATWRGPVLHHSGTIGDHMYVVVHTADGSFEGTIAWQKSTQSDNSSHFIVAKDGRIAQVNDTANKSGAQKAGNPYSISIENEGNENTPLTAQQIEANARILAKAHQVHGIPLQLTGKVGTRGLGHHSMGAESGSDWGHSLCPGTIIKGQKPAILARAIQIVNGVSAAAPTQKAKDPMIFTVKETPAFTAVDCVGEPVVNTTRVMATPAGPFALEYDEMIAWYNANGKETSMLPMSWARINTYCGTLKQEASTISVEVTEDVILSALESDRGKAAIIAAANAAEDS